MTIPRRVYNSPEYRYGFQGQEKDDEIKGNGRSINYKFRMHDPRIGRFFAADPLERNYPYYSPYIFSGNKVIAYRELEGMEQRYYAIYLTEENGACIHELPEKERESSFFSPDSNTYFLYNDHDGTPIASYTFSKKLSTLNPDQAINIHNPYERYKEFVENPIGAVLSGEFKTNGQVLGNLAENVLIGFVTRKMGNLPKGAYNKAFVPISGGKYVSPWVKQLRERVNNVLLNKLKSHGTGPAKGTIEISSSVKSLKKILSFEREKIVDFVYDPKSKRMLVAQSDSPNAGGHTRLYNLLGIKKQDALGGRLKIRNDGTISTSEWSGHTGTNWNTINNARSSFLKFIKKHFGSEKKHIHSEGDVDPK